MGTLTAVGAWSPVEENRFQEALARAQEARLEVERHDPQTYQHGIRVAYWARLIAKRLPSFDRRSLRRLEISALLHDYGKLFIPSSILNKPGPLEPHEWSLVRMHPVMGAIRAPQSFDYVDKSTILWHHKRFDGLGYPDGEMAGHKIPIGARITAVADVFDAITSCRAYRPAPGSMSTRDGMRVLREMAGTILDPTLVSLFGTIFNEASSRKGGNPGIKTLTVEAVMAGEIDRARALLQRELGRFDPRDPLGGEAPPPGLVARMQKDLMHTNLDERSAANVVRHVLGLPLPETFGRDDLAMDDEQLASAVRRKGNHEEAVLYVKAGRFPAPYMSIVVFKGRLWMSVGEKVGDKTRVSLIR